MALVLNLTAHDPADIAALVNQALDHDRAEHSIELDDDGDITISIEIRAARRNQLPIQPGRGAAPPACDHPADLADPVHCHLLPGHDLPHRSHGLTWNDDGTLLPPTDPTPHDDDPLLTDDTDPHETERQEAADSEPEVEEHQEPGVPAEPGGGFTAPDLR